MYRTFQSEGENGDLIERALPGESVTGEYMHVCGMRSRRSVVGSLADTGLGAGEGGGRVALAILGLSRAEKVVLVALDGTDIGEGRRFSNLNLGNSTPALAGLVNTGVRALRNSV
jgi:hypothetical protein